MWQEETIDGAHIGREQDFSPFSRGDTATKPPFLRNSRLARAIGTVQRDIGSGIADETVDCVHICRE